MKLANAFCRFLEGGANGGKSKRDPGSDREQLRKLPCKGSQIVRRDETKLTRGQFR
jgi:hypothetical protein